VTEPFHAATEWERIAKEQPDALALIHGSVTRTWRQFEERAARLAGALGAAGLARGDRVAIDLRNCPEFLETWFAALKQRCTPVAVNFRYLEEELRYLLLDCDARAVVYHASFSERIADLVEELRAVRIFIEVADETPPGDVASVDRSVRYEDAIASGPAAPAIRRDPSDPTLAYTGGTTGLPKGVEGAIWNPAVVPLLERVHLVPAGEQALATIRGELGASGSRPVVLPCSPLMHATAMTMVSEPALHLGGTVVTLTSHSLDPDEVLDCIERHRVTHLAITGDPIARPLVDALDRLASSGRVPDLSSVRLIASAGVAWSADVKDRLFAYMPDVTLYDACGSTEGATYGFSYLRAGDPTSTSRFTAAPGVIVIDDTGRPLTLEQPGLLAAPSARDGYAGDPDRSAAVFREIDGEQFTVPGDYGILHSDGTVTLIGRGSSTINTGGEKVFPEEVEEIIVSITGVADCAVLGVPDPRWGQRVVALVQRSPASSVDAERVITAVRRQLASYKAPKDVVFGDVPRTATGKLDRGSARARVGRALAPASRAERSPRRER
jgi:3-oxocholest-4-en-26-oate---CoA ligase